MASLANNKKPTIWIRCKLDSEALPFIIYQSLNYEKRSGKKGKSNYLKYRKDEAECAHIRLGTMLIAQCSTRVIVFLFSFFR